MLNLNMQFKIHKWDSINWAYDIEKHNSKAILKWLLKDN